TTTMRILTCYLPPTDGTARVAGYDVFESPLEVKRRVGYIPETPPLYPDMDVDGFLDFCAKIKGVPSASRKAKIDEAVGKTRIPDVRGRLIGRLSKGYRQRVGLAQALIADRDVLILDEPTIGLDPKQIVGIRQLIKSLAGAHTVILSTHILPEVSMVCEAVIIINRGRVVASGPLDRLMQELSPTARVQVQVEGPPELVAQSLRALPGVQRVESRGAADGASTFVLEAERTRDVRREIAQLAAQQRWGLLELKALDLSLEDVFIRIVAGEEHEETMADEAAGSTEEVA